MTGRDEAPVSTPSARRRPNRRGEGSRLRQQIVEAAAAILEQTRSPSAITLRAVARRIGVATTSIYAHFPDRDAIVAAVANRAYVELAAATAGARADLVDPVERLLAGCRAYLDYARDRPHFYALLFTTTAVPGAPPGSRTPSDGAAFTQRGDPGATSFGSLVQAIASCVSCGASASADPVADAAAVWVALHGYATLRVSVPNFPWPPEDAMFDHLVRSLARIRPIDST